MIYLIFIAAMVALVVIIAIQQNDLEKAHQKHWDEVRDHAETRKKLAALEQLKEKQEESPLVADKAIRQRYPRKPTPMDYYTLFEANPIGRDILDDLVNLFGGVSYTRGGHDADRETCFKAGKKFVVDHIIIQANKATTNQQNQSEVTTDDN
ncbi:hypothetical protein LNJ60_004068 [Acinetobacter baumannii]|nr:hypothetical protein [Acinetobacter baumannii]EKU7313801.1 hypothetical protein [Acinetobacter baumannii]